MEEPSARFNHILAAVGGKSYLLGGETDPFRQQTERDRVASVLSVFDHGARQWEADPYVIGLEEKPPGIRSGGFVAGGKFIYSFGGRADTGFGRYNTLHKFDTEEMRWIAFPPNVNSAEAPIPKGGCEPVIIDNKLCLFGGFGTRTADQPQPGSSFDFDEGVYDRGNTNEFHVYNLNVAIPTWLSGKVSGDRPPPCSYYSLTLVDSRRAVMFGGYTKTGRVNDVYIMTLDGIDANFRKMRKYGPWPKKRSSHTACVLNYDQEFPQVLIAGGLDENTQALGDLWLLSVDHGMWIEIRDHEDCLHRWRPIVSCVSSADKKAASVLVFGGVDSQGYKLSLTTVLEFMLVDNSATVPEWIMEEVVVLGGNNSDRTQKRPVQAVEDDGEYNYVLS